MTGKSKLLLALLWVGSLDARTEIQDNPTRGVSLMLRSGQLLMGDIIGLEEGIFHFRDKEGIHHLPMGWLLPESARFIRENQGRIVPPDTLPQGPYTFEPAAVQNFTELRQIQIDTQEISLVFVDPSGKLVAGLKGVLARHDELKSGLSFLPTYQVGKEAELDQAELMSRQYKFKFPGILILRPGKPTEALSDMRDPVGIARAIAPLAAENAAKQKAQAEAEAKKQTLEQN